jgi:hypothetical protein
MTEHDPEFAKDLLRGAEEIAQFLYGDQDQRRRSTIWSRARTCLSSSWAQ